MKTTMLLAGSLALSLLGTGCATHKYVAKTIAPVEQRVSGTESKNADQDKQISAQGTQIENQDSDLSRTKEKLNDTDAKATAAGDAAKQAGSAAQAADAKARGAQESADGARIEAKTGLDHLSRNVDGMNKFKMLKDDSVLFALGQHTLNKDAKAQLDDFATSVNGQERYVIEVQGFTDKTGSMAANDILSQERAETVARYLAAQHNVPLRNITVLGTGVAQSEQKTREDRKQSRKVEIRVFVPEVTNVTATTASN